MSKIAIEKTDDDQLTLKVYPATKGSRAARNPTVEIPLTEAELDFLHGVCKAGVRANVFPMSQEV